MYHGDENIEAAIPEVLLLAADQGLPSLQREAVNILQEDRRVGKTYPI